MMQRTAVALGLLALVAALCWSSAGSLQRVQDGSASFDELVGLLAALAAWLLLCWVAASLLLAALTTLPGRAGTVAARLDRYITPRALRGVTRTALGLTLTVTPLVTLAACASPSDSTAATIAAAAPRIPTVAPVGRPHGPVEAALARSYKEASADAQSPVPSPGRPRTSATQPAGPARESAPAPSAAAQARAEAPVPAPTQPPGWVPQAPVPSVPAPVAPADIGLVSSVPRTQDAVMDEVVVRRGDTLWSIAARTLGAHPSVSEVATAWPRWYTANRDLIGPDPSLIEPGQVLVAPQPG